jgi:hypothetical protein
VIVLLAFALGFLLGVLLMVLLVSGRQDEARLERAGHAEPGRSNRPT